MQLTEYETAQPLRPDAALAVEGSDVNLCVRSREMLDRDRQPVPMEFDRCSPIIIAFSNRAVAERFAEDHGGTVDRFIKVVAHPKMTAVH